MGSEMCIRDRYIEIARLTDKWSKFFNRRFGLVVGATHSDVFTRIRQNAPNSPFLIPGIGAQGGNLEASVLAGTDKEGEMAIINSSRGIIYASDGKDFSNAARKEAVKLRDEINRFREKKEKG